MLAACGRRHRGRRRRRPCALRPSPLEPFELDVPGDPSQAAFWVVAACIVPGSDLIVEDVYLGPARAGFLDVLRRMGADIEVDRRAATVPGPRRREPARPPTSSADEIPGLIDEIPVLAVAAAVADGRDRRSAAPASCG